jgi:LAS superfamily LD-carboxypeptidase LdcB
LFTVLLRRVAFFVAASLVAGGIAAPLAAADDGASLRDKIQRQQELRDQRAAQAVKLDALKADDKQVSSAIGALQANVKSHQTKLVQANQRSTAADQELANAQTIEAEKAAYLAEMQSSARHFALQAYVSPTDELGAVMGAADGNGPYRAGLASLQASQFAKTLDDLAAAQADLATARATAERAANQASRRKAEANAQLQRLQQVLGQQEQLSDQIDNRLDDALAEADALQTLDAQLAGQIRAEQAAVAAQLQAARLAAEQAAARNGISLAAPGSGRAVGSPIGAISVTTVGGITVNVSIAGQIAALLRDAAAAGINLGGGGYRSADGQVAVRRNNCGPTQYDIYQKPSSQCRPPAARPGQSMHEQGLAIDFTCNGAIIGSRSGPCWSWLARNAGRYGLMGNSREAWHWSTNGR